MNKTIVTQSIFNTSASSRSWRSYLTSGVVHIVVIAILFAVTFPFIQTVEIRRHPDNITLIAPAIPEYKPQIIPHVSLRPPVVRNEVRPKPFIPVRPVEVKPAPVKPVTVAAALEIKAVVPVSVPHVVAEPKFEPPAPKPEIHTGSFQSADAAKAPKAAEALKVGGFGDPNGVAPSANSKASSVMMAKVGSFDMPQGAGNAGGGGHSAMGVVHQTGFGSIGQNGTAGGKGNGGTVRTGGFGDSAPSAAPTVAASAKAAEPVFTPVEILSKPKPAYTQEARDLKLEGQVSLEVQFLSNGSLRILRIVHGLGHGLDEAAEQAAMQVRFRPATRAGVPVDTNATIHITFQLT